MAHDPAALLAEYEASLARMREMLAIIPPELRDQAPIPGEWTARQVLVHIADSEIMGAARLRQLLAEPEPNLYFYDQAGWAERLGYADASPEDAIALAIVIRRATLGLLKRARPEDWARRGTHPLRGSMTLADLVELYINHIKGHTEQLQQLAAALERA